MLLLETIDNANPRHSVTREVDARETRELPPRSPFLHHWPCIYPAIFFLDFIFELSIACSCFVILKNAGMRVANFTRDIYVDLLRDRNIISRMVCGV